MSLEQLAESLTYHHRKNSDNNNNNSCTYKDGLSLQKESLYNNRRDGIVASFHPPSTLLYTAKIVNDLVRYCTYTNLMTGSINVSDALFYHGLPPYRSSMRHIQKHVIVTKEHQRALLYNTDAAVAVARPIDTTSTGRSCPPPLPLSISSIRSLYA